MGVTYNYGAGPTYVKVASQTLSANTASVTFSSIPQGYTDLVLIANRFSSALDDLSMQFNGDTGSNYSFTVLYGTGSVAGSARGSNTNNPYLDYYAASESSFPAPVILNIQNYANSTTYKTTLARGSNASRGADATVMLWRSTSAITSILLKCHDGANFNSGSTFTLYGVAAALKPKATGGTVMFDPATSKWVHTFTSSGAFTPTQGLTVDYLVVAGGGGGGYAGGGGGAGGYRTSIGGTALSLALNTNYTVTVGGGGTGAIGSGGVTSTQNTAGSNSVFSTITSSGGGKGSNYDATTGGNGGSGGGGGGGDSGNGGTGNSGSYSPSEGNNGGNGATSFAGGGGGASAAGAAGVDPNAGAGGAGLASSITGTSVTRAGGGGGRGSTNGGAGGAGGGGVGCSGGDQSGGNGTVNTGSGGGGGGNSPAVGGAGGSGIVIVRYSA